MRPLLALCLTATPALACEPYDAAVAAITGGDMPMAAALYEEIATDPSCTDAFREWMGDALAKAQFAITLTDAAPDAKRAALQKALGYEKHWRSYAALGDLDWEAREFVSAATHYQLAINELVDGDPTHEATTDEIAEIYELASAALALADSAVEMPRTRSGDAGGVLATSIRGFEVEEVPLPITFEYNSTTFDPKGADYARTLADHLLAYAPARVALNGHTDPRGTEEYNLELSEARAAALSDFLRDAGFQGEISITGYGESRLPDPPPGIAPGSEDHYRIARRVAFATP